MHRCLVPLVAALVLLTGCATATLPIPKEWTSVPPVARIGSVALDDGGKVRYDSKVVPGTSPKGPIHIEEGPIGPRLMNGRKAITDPFLRIDSFDYSESRGEVIFSAKRDADFDIGLVSADGGAVHWLPDDPADEVGVQWAPRGNKVSYIIHAKGGDVVRTLHIPTSFELVAGFPNASVHALGWDPEAEHYAVVYSTPDGSDRIEVLTYDGGKRRVAVPPAAKLDVDVEPFAADAIVLRPRDLRYGERLPVVVWVAADDSWSDERAALIRETRVAMILTRDRPTDELWKTIAATPWIDASRAFLVIPNVAPNASPTPSAVLITTDQALAAGRYRRTKRVVEVPPAVVQSFAPCFIAEQLKRTTHPNATSR